jgi:hypothetical protein
MNGIEISGWTFTSISICIMLYILCSIFRIVEIKEITFLIFIIILFICSIIGITMGSIMRNNTTYDEYIIQTKSKECKNIDTSGYCLDSNVCYFQDSDKNKTLTDMSNCTSCPDISLNDPALCYSKSDGWCYIGDMINNTCTINNEKVRYYKSGSAMFIVSICSLTFSLWFIIYIIYNFYSLKQ